MRSATVSLALAALISLIPGSPAYGVQVRVAIVATGDVGHYAGMCDAPAGTDSLVGTLELKNLDDSTPIQRMAG